METNASIDNILPNVHKAIGNSYEREYFDLHEERYRFILKKILALPLKSGAAILDVGCYPPHLMSALGRLGFHVSGIASPHEPIKSNSVVILNLEKDRLPFQRASYDLVLFSEVIEHLVVNPMVYLSEFHRVLAPGGRLLITTPNAAGLHKLIPIFLGRSTYFPLEQLFATQLDDGSLYHRHNREFTMVELKEVMKTSGFRVNEATFFSAYKSRPLRPNASHIRELARSLAYVVTDVFPTRRDSLYIEAVPQRRIRSFVNFRKEHTLQPRRP